MAKTNRPLRGLVDVAFRQHPVIQDLLNKGNDISFDACEYDFIISSVSWRVIPGMEDQQIPLAIKAARKVRYGKKGDADEGASDTIKGSE